MGIHILLTFKMAALAKLVRTGASVARTAAGTRTLAVSSIARKQDKMNDPIDHATGLEKWELEQLELGNDDPFFMKPTCRGKGTKDQPNIVQAMDTYRMIGCVCNEEDTNIKFMWLYEGTPKRCKCGHWFKLEVHEAPSKEKLNI